MKKTLSRLSVTALVRLLISLLALTGVLLLSYEALTSRRFDRSNSTVGPLTGSDAAGQSFIARYPNLSGIDLQIGTYGRGADPKKSPLILHVRASPGSGPDLATATLPSDSPIGENAWYRFNFPAIATSQDRPLYFEVESPGAVPEKALTLYWWESGTAPRTDPYPLGNAYRDGIVRDGDLAFVLRYSPAPIDAGLQAVRALTANFPPYQLLIISVSVLLLLWFTLFKLPAIWRDYSRRVRWVRRWSLPFVLALALLNGVVYLQTIPPWQGWDEHGHFMYAALLDRHGLDNREVQDLEWWDGGRDREEIVALKSVIWGSMQRYNWSRLVAGYTVPGSTDPPLGNAAVFSDFVFEIRQPPAYYLLCASAINLGRSLGFAVDPTANPEAALGVMRAISLSINLGVVALAWLGAALLSSWRANWLRILLPLTVALLPMHTYIAVSADNDILGELAASALFVALIALLRGPYGVGGLLRAGLVIMLVGACALAKSSALVAALPLSGLGLALWLGMIVSRFMKSRLQDRIRVTRSRLMIPFSLVLVFLCLATLAGALAVQDEAAAAGWQIGSPVDRAARVEQADVPDGRHLLRVQPGQAAYQWIDLPFAHPAITLTLSLAGRPAQPGGSPPEAVLIVDERGRLPLTGAETLTIKEVRFPLTSTVLQGWMQYRFEVPARVQDRKVMVRLIAGSVAADFDDISLKAEPQDAGESVEPARLAVPLFNGSAEVGSRRLAPLVSRIVPEEQEHILDVLINPQAYDKMTIARRYAYRQFRSFWGNFGWVSLPLPEPVFASINVVIVLAISGLILILARRFGRWSSAEWLGIVSLVSLVAAIVMGFAKQVAPLSTSGVHADPHGRYLFVLIIPIIWLLLAGLASVYSVVSGWISGLPRRPQQELNSEGHLAHTPWGIWFWSVTLLFFALYCLAALIIPYYYG